MVEGARRIQGLVGKLKVVETIDTIHGTSGGGREKQLKSKEPFRTSIPRMM